MMDGSKRAVILVLLLVLAGGIVPLALYWSAIGRMPSVSPQEAKAALTAPSSTAVLVDVRESERFNASHLEGAVNWSCDGTTLQGALPDDLRGKALFLICDSGIRSAKAVPMVGRLTTAPVYSVRGGMQAWIAQAGGPAAGRYCALQSGSGAARGFPFRVTSRLDQWLTVLHAFVLKPLYSVAALVIVVLLWRKRGADLRALKWGLLAFFLGEEACAANFVFCRDASILLEYLHDYGMVLCFGFCSYALIIGLDERVIRYSDPGGRCAFLGLCRACIKHAPVPCGLERAFYLVLPASFVLAAMPLFATPKPLAYATEILGRRVALSHPMVHQIYESRICALSGLALIGASFLVFCLKRDKRVYWAEVLFAAGLGPGGFGLFRLVLFWGYREDLGRFNFWEEMTEFLFIAAVAAVLWIFRKGLFAMESREETAKL